MKYGDMTGVLMQCTFANTPVVSPQKKAPTGGAFVIFKLSLSFAAIVAQLCQA
jgi:hypothetical protein